MITQEKIDNFNREFYELMTRYNVALWLTTTDWDTPHVQLEFHEGRAGMFEGKFVPIDNNFVV